MKILHIVPTYFPAVRYGGPIKSVHELNKWLVKNGVDVTVYTTNVDGSDNLNVPLGEVVNIDGVKVFYFKSSFPRAWFYSYDLHKALKKNAGQFDLIHITSVFLSASTLGAHYAKKFKKPYIISPRGSLMKSPLVSENILKKIKKRIYISLIEKRNLKDAAAIHFAVPAEREEYIREKFPIKKAIILPNIIKLKKSAENFSPGYFRKKFNISDDKKIIIYLGRLNWIKGFDTLIPAFAEIVKKESKAVLVIAGGDDEGYGKNLKSQISNFKISDKAIFTGILALGEEIAALRDSNIFVMPSYSESFGMAVVEAMSVGLPVVVTKGVGISSYIAQAEAGIVVEKKVSQVMKAILKILENPDLSKKMGENAKKLVEEEFSSEKVAEKWIKEYNDLIRK